jgi:hypothetical protein
MKRTAIFLMSAALTACASAPQSHDHAAPAQPGAMMSGGMHEHMQLMREHMMAMEQSMAKMQGMQGMGCGQM